MFIDYLTLMLVNMAAGLFILSVFVARGLTEGDQRKWTPAFAAVGLVASVCGFAMSFGWPLPGSYNMAFGELSVLFGSTFLAAALCMALGWSLAAVAIYAFFGGLASLIVGVGIIRMGMTKAPLFSGVGFIITGLGGILAYATLRLKGNAVVRRIGSLAMLAAAIIWALVGYMAYWDHLSTLKTWHPATMKQQQ